MSEPVNSFEMPERDVLVARALARFDVRGGRNKLLELDTVTLTGLGLLLTDRSANLSDAHKWLNAELGGTDEAPAVHYNVLKRFAQAFRDYFEQVTYEARNNSLAAIAEATQGDIEKTTAIASRLLLNLATGKLADTKTFEQIDRGDLANLITAINSQGPEGFAHPRTDQGHRSQA